jgi:hypothetical protein
MFYPNKSRSTRVRYKNARVGFNILQLASQNYYFHNNRMTQIRFTSVVILLLAVTRTVFAIPIRVYPITIQPSTIANSRVQFLAGRDDKLPGWLATGYIRCEYKNDS